MPDDVSPELQPLLEAAQGEIARVPPDLAALKAGLERLLIFLCTPQGRTEANCHATFMFFLLTERWPTGSPDGWDHLPEDYAEILDDLAGCLHDTIESPAIALNFDSTPEQLLQRVRILPS